MVASGVEIQSAYCFYPKNVLEFSDQIRKPLSKFKYRNILKQLYTYNLNYMRMRKLRIPANSY